MANKSVGAQVKSGFRLTGVVLLMLGWLGLVFAGLIAGVAPGNAHRPVLGWGLLILAAAAFFWTMNRWIRVFPGLVALATLNALAAVVFTGHATGDPSMRLAPRDAVIYSVLLTVCTIVSFRFTKRKPKLRVLDRIGVFGFVFCIFWPAVDERVQIIAPAVACGLLALAWAYDRIQQRRNRKHGTHANLSRGEIRLDGDRSHDYP